MQTYQIDLDLLLDSEETYQKSAEELEEKIDESKNVLDSMDEDTYAGDDADNFRLLFSKHLEVYFLKTAEITRKVVQKLFFAHNTGRYCKKKCYDFIGAFGGGEGTRDSESFGGKLYCDQNMIVMLRGEANVAMAYGENIHNLASTAEELLQQLQIVSFNTGIYVSRINTCYTKINQLEDYSARLTEYAELVETMDDNLQKGLQECIPKYYEMTADGVDDRQAYLQMEYNETELERLLKIPEDELTEADRAKLAVMLNKLLESDNYDMIEKLKEEGIFGALEVNILKENERFMIEVMKVGQWYVDNIHTYCHLDAAAYADVEARKAQGESVSVLDKGAKEYICSLEGNLSGIVVYDDCSGLVTACLQQAGYFPTEIKPKINSAGFLPGGKGGDLLEDAGFEWYSFSTSGTSDIPEIHLQEGDILVKDGHVEIFSHFYDDGIGHSYTWGKIYEKEPVYKDIEKKLKDNFVGIWRLKDD